jgi:pyrroloquinoline quinone biosynthesis protein B
MVRCDSGDSAIAPPESPGVAPASGPFVRVLGSVQDGGLPHAAYDCARCRAARHDPARKRWIASLAIRLPDSDQIYLVDATPDIREQLHAVGELRGESGGFDRTPLEGVFLTHAHIGHYLGLAFFGFEAVHTRDLSVYCMPRMAELLRRNAPWEQLVTLGNVRLEPGGDTTRAVTERGFGTVRENHDFPILIRSFGAFLGIPGYATQ